MVRIGGFVFEDDNVAQRAQKEADAAAFLENRIPYNQPEKALQIYNKMADEEIFETPLGCAFLLDVQNKLQKTGRVDPQDILPIAIKPNSAGKRETPDAADEKKGGKKKEKEKKGALRLSIIINLVLVAAIVAMLVISATGETVTVLNYENKLINRYEEWEKELDAREQEIKAYEEMYGIGLEE